MGPDRLKEWFEAVDRHMLVCIGCACINTCLFAVGKLTEAGYLEILMMTVGSYLTAGCVTRFTDAKYSAGEQK